MEAAHVTTLADHDGWVTYYIVPAERADEFVDVEEFYDKKKEVVEETFHSPAGFAEWARENPETEITGYWESRGI